MTKSKKPILISIFPNSSEMFIIDEKNHSRFFLNGIKVNRTVNSSLTLTFKNSSNKDKVFRITNRNKEKEPFSSIHFAFKVLLDWKKLNLIEKLGVFSETKYKDFIIENESIEPIFLSILIDKWQESKK